MAHVQKRGPRRWRARYLGPDGKERSKTFARKTDADKYIATMTTDIARGLWIDPKLSRTPFADWVVKWQPTTHGLRRSTRLRSDGIVTKHLLPRFGPVPLALILRTDVQGFVSDLLGTGLSVESTKRIYAVLRVIFREAEENGMIARSPCVGVRFQKVKRAEMRFFAVDELEALAEAHPYEYRALPLLGAYGGLRWAEMVGLRVRGVDFLRSKVTVEDTLLELAASSSAGRLRAGKPEP